MAQPQPAWSSKFQNLEKNLPHPASISLRLRQGCPGLHVSNILHATNPWKKKQSCKEHMCVFLTGILLVVLGATQAITPNPQGDGLPCRTRIRTTRVCLDRAAVDVSGKHGFAWLLHIGKKRLVKAFLSDTRNKIDPSKMKYCYTVA